MDSSILKDILKVFSGFKLDSLSVKDFCENRQIVFSVIGKNKIKIYDKKGNVAFLQNNENGCYISHDSKKFLIVGVFLCC